MAIAPHKGWVVILLLSALLWGVNLVWLVNDTRPPVWDMALHQAYAIGYLDPSASGAFWEKSGNYPPLVHLVIAILFFIFHPGPHIAAFANLPATLILFWAVYELAHDLAGERAALWACILTALVPYLIWMSRETVLDYWLSALFAAALVFLRKTEGFRSRRWSLAFGILIALGMLTKWFFAGLIMFPLLYVYFKNRVWSDSKSSTNAADSMIVAGLLASVWYLPNIPRLVQYFPQNAAIGAREGEPPILSLQSFIYYLRLLEGYQLFAALSIFLALSVFWAWKKHLIRDWLFLFFGIAGGWLVMTLLRTKDPRFTMPLLGPLMIIPGAWIQSWRRDRLRDLLLTGFVALLCFQAYAANFGVSWLPGKVVLLPGYQGSLRWDWNLYLQNYFDLLGEPRREDWKQSEILGKLAADSALRKKEASVALVPDLPLFNESNFRLFAAMRGMKVPMTHLQSADKGFRSFEGYNYAIMTESRQGMSWTTAASEALNKIIVDNPKLFCLVGIFTLPNGDGARLYFIDHGKAR